MSDRRPPLDLRLALPVAVSWLVVGILLGVEGAAAPAALVAALLSVLLILISGGRRRGVLLTIALASAASALLLACAAASVDGRRPSDLVAAAEESRHLTIEATATQAVVQPAATARFGARIERVEGAGLRMDAAVPVTIFATVTEPIEVGDHVTVSGTLAVTSPADASAFLFFSRGQASVEQLQSGPVAWAGELREGFRTLVADMPQPGAGLLPGLAIGDTSAVNESLEEQMKASSLTHLTAVSGANCAIVVGLVLALGAGMRAPRSLRVLTSLGALALFVLIVTPEPSVMRASAMAVAVLVTKAWGRGAAGVPVLALAVLVLLAIDPWLARSYGFILSVLATAGLLVLAGPLAARMATVLPTPLAAVIAVPLAAQLACQPVIILLAPAIPSYGVLANLLAGPAAPAATVLGLVACVVNPLAPWAAEATAWVAWLPSAWIAAVAAFFSGLPGAQLPWAEGAFGFGLAAVLTVLGLGVTLARRRRWWTLGLCGVLVIAGGIVAGDRIRVALHTPGEWQFAACDVGQGDAQLLRDSDSVMLVDAGPDAAALDDCLSHLGISHIDVLVLSHFDLDHVGGVDAVVGRVGTVVAGPPASAEDERMLRDLADAGAQVVPATRGLAGELGRLRWTVLWPARTPAMPPGNDASVVLAVNGRACQCLSTLLLGDLGREAQLRMLAGARSQLSALGGVDIVKVSHHGSVDQYERLYESVPATIGVIGVGTDNTYGHPTPSILSLLGRLGTAVARTDEHGLVLAWARDDGRIGVWSETGQVAPASAPDEDVAARH
ncbi:ComEC/Rec2 family competence protein [Salinibacterium sp. GXW1014]|uniref:ComEC/Rec2 family competence protein n=1 Tax=Salinibacterium sp. GXW1014 TaxID=3377838 RepID=UPI00383A7AA4